jgi:hypothetical protein
MTKIKITLSAIAVSLLLTNSSSAQAYCEQVKLAVAIYGYAAAKAHAQAHYSREAVEAADRCLTGSQRESHRDRDHNGDTTGRTPSRRSGTQPN